MTVLPKLDSYVPSQPTADFRLRVDCKIEVNRFYPIVAEAVESNRVGTRLIDDVEREFLDELNLGFCNLVIQGQS